ncbi:hypothetical protein QUC31_004225 [Theobroma cacao]|nr:Defensin-like protein 20-28 - like 1 [Theobroma cacao]WRX10067.1 Defensin-like protein 20-28 - like 3 [Theobroma cacao]
MGKVKVFSFLLLSALILFIDFGQVQVVAAQAVCCNNHPELGRCLPGQDDNPQNGGKCWNYCVSGCQKGGFCKRMNDGHHECHCFC